MADQPQAAPLCEHCGKPLPAKTPTCPNCGAFNLSPERQQYIRQKNRTWVAILGAFVGCALLIPIVLFLGALAVCSNMFHGYH